MAGDSRLTGVVWASKVLVAVGLLAASLAFGPTRPAHAACGDSGDIWNTPCVTATSVTPSHITVNWETRNSLDDGQYRVNTDSSRRAGQWGVDTGPDSDYVIKVQGCIELAPPSTDSCDEWGEVRVHTPGAPDLYYGPDTCPQGLVWRETVPADHVCVTPEERAKAQAESKQQDIR